MKYIIAVLFLFVLAACSTPPENIESAQIGNVVRDITDAEPTPITSKSTWTTASEASFFEFEGFGVGKSHVGNFTDYSAQLLVEDGVIVGAKGTIQAASVDTGISKLDAHLQTDDFFDVDNYPVIVFEESAIDGDQMVGVLDFHGVQEQIAIPIERTENSIKAYFLLDTTPFNIKYTGINKDVRISFEMILP